MRPAAESLAAPRVRRSLLRDARVNRQLHLLLPINLLGSRRADVGSADRVLRLVRRQRHLDDRVEHAMAVASG